MRHVEGRYLKAGKPERYLLEDGRVIFLDALRDAVSAQQSGKHARSAEKAQVAVMPQQRIGIARMVGMVVGEQQALHPLDIDIFAAQHIRDYLRVDAGIYDYPLCRVAYVAAVAARTGAEADIFNGMASRIVDRTIALKLIIARIIVETEVDGVLTALVSVSPGAHLGDCTIKTVGFLGISICVRRHCSAGMTLIFSSGDVMSVATHIMVAGRNVSAATDSMRRLR